MGKVLLAMKGLPASGKSSYAKELVLGNPNYKRINRDDLRAMTDIGKHSQSKEKHIRALELMHAEYFFSQGFSVVIDDCNLSPSAQQMWTDCAKKHNATLVWKDFTNVSVEECIARDKKRPNYVGEDVIMNMYNTFLRKPDVAPVYDESLPDAIIVDLDGTLALFDRSNSAAAYDRDFLQDTLSPVVGALVRQEIAKGTTILITSGRRDVFYEMSHAWLVGHDLLSGPHQIFMRKDGDGRKDVLVKKDIYEESIKGRYNVKYVLDDRDQVVDLWRSLGLVCLQVAEGRF